MSGDPLAVYRLPRASQVELLGLLSVDRPRAGRHEEGGGGYLRVGPRADPVGPVRSYDVADPTLGARLPRDPRVVAVDDDARRRADRFRVA